MLLPRRPAPSALIFLNAYGLVGTLWLGGPGGGERFAVSP